jgi:hypothetical protein
MKNKVDEQTLITYLEQMNEIEKPTTSIKVILLIKFSLKGKLIQTMMMILEFKIKQLLN